MAIRRLIALSGIFLILWNPSVYSQFGPIGGGIRRISPPQPSIQSIPVPAAISTPTPIPIPIPTVTPTLPVTTPTSGSKNAGQVGSRKSALTGENNDKGEESLARSAPPIDCRTAASTTAHALEHPSHDEAGIVNNWRFNLNQQKRIYDDRLSQVNSQNGGKPFRYFAGSPLSANSLRYLTWRNALAPDHTDISAQTSQTSTETDAPTLQTFESNSLGAYSFETQSSYSRTQLNQDLSQCNGNFCATMMPYGASNTGWFKTFLKVRFKATDGIGRVNFKYSGFFPVHFENGGSPPERMLSAYVLSENGGVAISPIPLLFYNDFRACPPSGRIPSSVGTDHLCQLRNGAVNLSALQKNRNYILVFEAVGLLTAEFSIDDIQFLDTNRREYGGPRRVTTPQTTTYRDVYTEFTRINGADKYNYPLTRFLSGNSYATTGWALVVPTANGASLTLDFASSLPADAAPTHKIQVNQGAPFNKLTNVVTSGNKKNYTGSQSLTIAPPDIFSYLAVKSDHKYFSQNQFAFFDELVLAFDKVAPQLRTGIVPIYNGVITTETPLLLYFSALDDLGLNTVGVVKQSTQGRSVIMENAFAVAQNGLPANQGEKTAAIEAPGMHYDNEPIKVSVDSYTTGLQIFVRDWVRNASGFRTIYGSPYSFNVYTLDDKNVVCDKYVVRVGDQIQCHKPAGRTPNTLVWVKDKGEGGNTGFRDANPKADFYNQNTDLFTAKKAGTFDLVTTFYDNNPSN
ncbi:MAG: hypothetical protein Q7S68_03985, partial [Deltaproteobacteria bacterium]|nr:hypothetical protein [Deltaproteobacteria bacterium]